MKITQFKFWVVSVIFFAISSCSSDNNDQVKLLKKIIETSDSGVVKTILFTYDGYNILTIDSDKLRKDFFYTGDLITKITTTDKVTFKSISVDYSYQNDKLIQAKSPNNYITNYTHNSNGTVAYVKFDLSVPNVETKLYEGILYFSNRNLVNEERILETTEVGTISKYNVIYDYDYSQNPYYNILGFDKILDHDDLISKNNYSISTVETIVEKNGQIISSATFYKNNFKYNRIHYPIENNSIVSIPEKGLSFTLKTEYFY